MRKLDTWDIWFVVAIAFEIGVVVGLLIGHMVAA